MMGQGIDGSRRVSFASFEKKESHWILLNLGQGYMDASLYTMETVFRLPHWRQGPVYSLLPALYNLHQGLETFIKGASLAIGLNPKKHHDLTHLFGDYNDKINADDLPHELHFRVESFQPLIQLNQKAMGNSQPGEAFRYLHDKQLNKVFYGLSLGEMHVEKMIRECKDECVRVHHAVCILKNPPRVEDNFPHFQQPWWETDEQYVQRFSAKLKSIGWSDTDVEGVIKSFEQDKAESLSDHESVKGV